MLTCSHAERTFRLNIFRRYWPHLVHPLALLPLALIVSDVSTNNLSANPIQEVTQRTGLYAIILLLLSLTCTPLNTVLGWKRVLTLRRPLGLYAFLYAVIHFVIFIAIDYGFDGGLIWEALAEKPYVVVGFIALLLLTPLAITSTKGWQKRLGKNWKLLHRLVYVVLILVIFHFIWLSKTLLFPLPYALFAALVLLLRIPPIQQSIQQFVRVQRSRLVARA
jgi:methionine sulfoxide reductase heme-binding subunit